MRIYFTNHKYLEINSFTEEFRRGNFYLSFGVSSTHLTLSTLKDFLTTENLQTVTIVDDNNNVIVTAQDLYHSVYEMNRQLVTEPIGIFVRLSSSADGLDTMA